MRLAGFSPQIFGLLLVICYPLSRAGLPHLQALERFVPWCRYPRDEPQSGHAVVGGTSGAHENRYSLPARTEAAGAVTSQPSFYHYTTLGLKVRLRYGR